MEITISLLIYRALFIVLFCFFTQYSVYPGSSVLLFLSCLLFSVFTLLLFQFFCKPFCRPFYSIVILSSGSKLWVLHWNTRGAAVQQREVAQQWRSLGGWNSGQHKGRLPLQIDSQTACRTPVCIREMIWSFTHLPFNYTWAPLQPHNLSGNIDTYIWEDVWYCTFMILERLFCCTFDAPL